jgi:hypothetical protein
VQSCEKAISKKETLFTKLTKLDLAGKKNDFQDPRLILNSLTLTKQDFDQQVDNLKALSIEFFYRIVEYHEEEVDNWLVGFSLQNGDIHEGLCKLSIDLRELENEVFNIRIHNEIKVAPLRSYVEENLKWINHEIQQGNA